MEITLKVEAPELTHAILELASAIAMGISAEAAKFSLAHQQSVTSENEAASTVQAPPVQPAYSSPAALAPTPAQQPSQVAPAPTVAPPMPSPVAPAPVPTSAPTYTMEQLAVAATQLVDAGRRRELVSLLNSFGVPALTALPKEQYGAFATQLRAMGAKI